MLRRFYLIGSLLIAIVVFALLISNDHCNKGNYFLKNGEDDLAILEYNKAIKINPLSYWAYNNRAIAYGYKGNLGQATSDFTKAIRINPRFTDAYINRGGAYGYAGRFDLSILDYETAIKINPKEPRVYYNLAVHFFQQGAYDKSWEYVNRAKAARAYIYQDFLEQLKEASGREE